MKSHFFSLINTLFLFGLSVSTVSAEDCSPANTTEEIRAAGISVETFLQKNTAGKQVQRRYLAYIPDRVKKTNKKVPVVIANHGSWNNAEKMRETTLGGFENFADKDGFIVVYSNAMPNPTDKPLSECDDIYQANRGWWREPLGNSGKGSDNFIDDEEYFQMILSDLIKKGIPVNKKQVFLTGVSGGGSMSMYAAVLHGERYRAIAPIAAPGLFSANNEKDGKQVPLSVFVIYSQGDPLYNQLLKWDGYSAHVQNTLQEWADALQVDTTTTKPIKLANSIHEGKDYEGDNTAALATRNSSVTIFDHPRGTTGKRLLVYQIDHGGHAGGNATQWGAEIIKVAGFRNQDFNSAEVIWQFFKGELEH